MATAGMRPLEAKFIDLKGKLEAMEYREPLGMDSLSLVERLVGDLVISSGRLEEAGSASRRLQGDKKVLQNSVYPFKKENSRLLRENNQLHLELIHRQEEIDERERQSMMAVKRSEGELKNISFVNKQYAQKLKVQERELSALKRRLHQVLKKNMVATESNVRGGGPPRPGRSAVAWDGRNQEMEMASQLAPVDGNEGGEGAEGARGMAMSAGVAPVGMGDEGKGGETKFR